MFQVTDHPQEDLAKLMVMFFSYANGHISRPSMRPEPNGKEIVFTGMPDKRKEASSRRSGNRNSRSAGSADDFAAQRSHAGGKHAGSRDRELLPKRGTTFELKKNASGPRPCSMSRQRDGFQEEALV